MLYQTIRWQTIAHWTATDVQLGVLIVLTALLAFRSHVISRREIPFLIKFVKFLLS